MKTPITVAFCGAGNIVRGNHLPAIEARPERFQVAGFYDVNADNAKARAGDKYRVYASYEELLADTAVDLVVVPTKPLSTHFPLALQAIEAGKHVLLEKPMCETAEECDKLIAAARDRDVTLTVHHNRRLDLDFLMTQYVLASGKIGEPRLVASCIGGGYQGDFVDWGVHLADQALLFNDSPLVEVSAFTCLPKEGRGNCGFGEITLRFAEPPITRVVSLPRVTEFLGNGTDANVRFRAYGTAGSFAQRAIEDVRDVMNAGANWHNARPDYAVPPFLECRQKDYYDFLYESLAEGKPLLVTPESARNAIRLLELMDESVKNNRTVPATNML